MANIYDVNQTELIEKVAEELKKIPELKPTEWAAFVKTGVSKERPPIRSDWWYSRAASILRNVYRFGPIGVSKLRTKYGVKKNRGVKPGRFYRASGNIIRKILQQLAKAELIKEDKKGVHKGKVITPKGVKLLSKAAGEIKESKPKKETPKKVEEKPAEKHEEKPKQEKKPIEAKIEEQKPVENKE